MREGRKETVPRSTRNLHETLRRYNEAPRRPRRRMFWPSQLLVISDSGRMVAAPVSGAVVEKGGREKTIEIPRFHDRGGGWRKDCSKREFDGEKGSMVPR